MKSVNRKHIPNISYTVNNDLCTGCGVCVDVCPHHAISIRATEQRVFRPVIDSNKCLNHKGCHRCYDICSGHGIESKRIADELFGNTATERNQYIGYYTKLYTGHSNIADIRLNGASGGLTSQFLIYLLEKNIIQGAVVTRFANSNPLMVNTFIATTKDEILQSKSSKYAPVTMAGIISQIKNRDGHFAIVGLPCHIHAFRKYEEQDKNFRKKIFAYIGLYCSCGRTFALTEYVLKKRGIKRENLESFAYRANGCMGNLKIVEKQVMGTCNSSQNSLHRRSYEENYENYYLSLRSFFNIHRCQFCTDHFAELADISFGDIHYGKYLEDKIGVNSVVVRRNDLNSILLDSQNEGYIQIDTCAECDLLASQIYAKTKKHQNPTLIRLRSKLHLPIPDYDEKFTLDSSLRASKSYFIKRLQMFIGRNHILHFLIPILSKKY